MDKDAITGKPINEFHNETQSSLAGPMGFGMARRSKQGVKNLLIKVRWRPKAGMANAKSE